MSRRDYSKKTNRKLQTSEYYDKKLKQRDISDKQILYIINLCKKQKLPIPPYLYDLSMESASRIINEMIPKHIDEEIPC